MRRVDELPPLPPAASEVALTGAMLLVFLVLLVGVTFWLTARLRSARGRADR